MTANGNEKWICNFMPSPRYSDHAIKRIRDQFLGYFSASVPPRVLKQESKYFEKQEDGYFNVSGLVVEESYYEYAVIDIGVNVLADDTNDWDCGFEPHLDEYVGGRCGIVVQPTFSILSDSNEHRNYLSIESPFIYEFEVDLIYKLEGYNMKDESRNDFSSEVVSEIDWGNTYEELRERHLRYHVQCSRTEKEPMTFEFLYGAK